MKNVVMTRDGSRLSIVIDLAAEGTPSASGKTSVLASTHGNIDVPDAIGCKIGLNLYAYDGYKITAT